MPKQKRGAEAQPRRRQIELQQIVLQLVPSDHNRSPWALTAIHNGKAQNVVVHLHHRVGPEHPPERALVLQHKVNARHGWPHTCAQHVVPAEAHLEGAYRGHSGNVHGFRLADKSLGYGFENGGLEDRVGVDGADLGPTHAVAVDRQQCRVDSDGFLVDLDGVDFDEVFGRGFPLGEGGGRADWIYEERGVD